MCGAASGCGGNRRHRGVRTTARLPTTYVATYHCGNDARPAPRPVPREGPESLLIYYYISR